jgi:hypothetical protein
MAFYNPDEEQDPNQEGQAQTGPESSIITGNGAGGTSSSPAPAAAGSPDKGGNFVGLQTYLDANKNQASKLGDQTAGVVTNSVDQARQNISGLNQKFNEQVDQNTVSKDEGATALAGSTPESLTPDQRNQVKKQYNAQYKGPTGLVDITGDYANTLDSTNKANQNLSAAQTEEGRGTLINQINSAPRTKGVTAFDNILLQKGPGRDKLAGVTEQNKDFKDILPQVQQAAQAKVGRVDDPSTPDVDESAGALGTTAKTQADTYKTVQDALNTWKQGFDPRLAAAQDTGLQDRVTQDFGGGDYALNQETMDLLGLKAGDVMYKNKFNDYLNPFSPTDVTAANVATPEDYARYGALADLAGVQDPALNQSDIAKAGTAPKFSLNKEKLQSDVKASEQKYNQDFNSRRDIATPGAIAKYNSGNGVSGPINSATPQELLDTWIPYYESKRQYGWGGPIADALKQIVNDFNNEYGKQNQISKG